MSELQNGNLKPKGKPFEVEFQPPFWIGLDGTRNGWSVCILDKDGKVKLIFVAKLDHLWSFMGNHDAIRSIAIDMPLALSDKAERGGRGCEREARRLLAKTKMNAMKNRSIKSQIPFVGPSSIFTPPTRPALEIFKNGGTHSQVSEANRNSAFIHDALRSKRQKVADHLERTPQNTTGLGLSIQSYNIMPKIVELDQFVLAGIEKDLFCFHPSKRNKGKSFDKICIFECHPELSFLSLSSKQHDSIALESLKALKTKKSLIGKQERFNLIFSSHLIDKQSLLLAAMMNAQSEKETYQITEDQIANRTSWSIHHSTPEQENEKLISIPSDDIIDSIVCALIAKKFENEKVISVGEEGEQDSRTIPMTIFV